MDGNDGHGWVGEFDDDGKRWKGRPPNPRHIALMTRRGWLHVLTRGGSPATESTTIRITRTDSNGERRRHNGYGVDVIGGPANLDMASIALNAHEALLAAAQAAQDAGSGRGVWST